MTAQEELARRISRDSICRAVQKKIDEGKADFSDTARYNDRAAELLGEVLAEYVPDIPPEARETLCKGLLRQRYLDTNAMLNAVQRTLDAAQGLHLAPQTADYPEERVDQAAHSLADETVPMETIQRRAMSAPATIARSFQDDYIEKNAAFRSSAGLKCYINRIAAGGCCKWCTAMAGRYSYGEEPDDIYRRHDNCSCTVTYENGRQRQDVWSKRIWEVPKKGGGAGPLKTLIGKKKAQKDLTILSKDDTIRLEKAYEYLSAVFGDVDKSISKLDKKLIIENVEQLKKLNARFGVLTEQNTGSIFSRKSKNVAETLTNLTDQNIGLLLSSKYYNVYDILIAAEKAGRDSFLYMPSADESLSVVTITHEYGHMLENAIIRSRFSGDALAVYQNALLQGQQAIAINYLKYEEQLIARSISDEIIQIAKESNPDFSLQNSLSEYGKVNDFEFFAEVFANSQCGAPNELGKAMITWLERSGF